MNTIITIDPRKNRIRFYKELLQNIGSPKYVQLLINPDKRLVAIKGVNNGNAADCVHKVDLDKHIGVSIEIYSLPFVQELCKVIGSLDLKSSYWLKGEVIQNTQMAVFSLNTIQKLSRGWYGKTTN